jgi:hypothetical protein
VRLRRSARRFAGVNRIFRAFFGFVEAYCPSSRDWLLLDIRCRETNGFMTIWIYLDYRKQLEDKLIEQNHRIYPFHNRL